MRSEGCLGVLKSVQNNPVSALELLDFSVRAFHKPHHSPVKKKVRLREMSALATYSMAKSEFHSQPK